MNKMQISPTQLQDLNSFNRILEQNQWQDPFDTQAILNAGREVSPEGSQQFSSLETIFEVQLHLPVKMISLKIKDISSGSYRKLHFLYDEKPDEFIGWVAKVSKFLSLFDYPLHINQCFEFKGMIMLELKDGSLIDLNPGILPQLIEKRDLANSIAA